MIINLTTGALSLCIFVNIVTLATSKSIKTKVNIPGLGSVLGAIDETAWTHQKIISFRGIPYAESPSGELRFQPPKRKAPWKELRDARNFGRVCPNYQTILPLNDTQRSEDLEDCLNLCVYTKGVGAKRPVMFFVHGGFFRVGSATEYTPRYLLEKDIVLVVTQYRIGALGLMTTFTKEIPGNAAIMDVQLALEWVHKNIHAFGGDPNQVTIIGHSCGAGLIGTILLSPTTSEIYFQRSIVQSASILAPWFIDRAVLDQVKRVCGMLGCEECNNAKGQNKCMRNANVVDLLNVTQADEYAIVVGDFHGVIPEEPKKLLANFNRSIPLMTGFTKHDDSLLLAKRYREFVRQYGRLSNITVRQFANYLIDQNKDMTSLANNLFLHQLFKPDILDTNNHADAWFAYFDIMCDLVIKSPTIGYANAVQRTSAPVYMYAFDYAGQYTRFNDTDGQLPFYGGIYHLDELIYLFDRFQLNANDTAFAKRMVNLWYSFAVDGEPKVENQPELIIPPMKSESGPYFHINKDITFANDILNELSSTIHDPESYKLIKPNASDIIAQ